MTKILSRKNNLRHLFNLYDRAKLMTKILFYKGETNLPEYNRSLYSRKKTQIKSRHKVIFINSFGRRAGIGDRIRGILTVYYYSKVNNIPFYINWDIPFKLTDYLVPSTINWEITHNDITFNKHKAFPIMPGISCSNFVYNKFDKLLFRSLFLPIHRKELHIFTNTLLHAEKYSELFFELFKPSDRLSEKLNEYKYLGKYYSFTFRFMQL